MILDVAIAACSSSHRLNYLLWIRDILSVSSSSMEGKNNSEVWGLDMFVACVGFSFTDTLLVIDAVSEAPAHHPSTPFWDAN
jgi:hypothetical protein